MSGREPYRGGMLLCAVPFHPPVLWHFTSECSISRTGVWRMFLVGETKAQRRIEMSGKKSY